MVDKLIVSVPPQNIKLSTATIRSTLSVCVTSEGMPRVHRSISGADKIIVTVDRRDIRSTNFYDLFQYACRHRSPENVIVVVINTCKDYESYDWGFRSGNKATIVILSGIRKMSFGKNHLRNQHCSA